MFFATDAAARLTRDGLKHPLASMTMSRSPFAVRFAETSKTMSSSGPSVRQTVNFPSLFMMFSLCDFLFLH